MRLNDHKFCIAPMMKKTDRHFRFLARQFTKKSMLYTEMIHSNAILKGDKEKLLSFSGIEHPVGLQLGGSDPEALAEAANIGETFGYDEINLNVGCPSKKVKSGNFGVFLMKDIELLCSCIKAMKKNTTIPLTIKCRIGVDQFEGEDYLKSFIEKRLFKKPIKVDSKTLDAIFYLHAYNYALIAHTNKDVRKVMKIKKGFFS